MNEKLFGYNPDTEPALSPISWDQMNRPLTLKAADEAGAFLDDSEGNHWYLSLNEMTYRPVTAADLPSGRMVAFKQYEMSEQTFEHGVDAAMAVRAKHLEEQLAMLALVKEDAANTIVDGLSEELALVQAYSRETDPKERGRLRNDLNEMYNDMQMEETEKPITGNEAA